MNQLDFSDPLGVKDPFNINSGNGREDDSERYRVHLRVQQRNARQRITTLTGLPNDYDLKGLTKSIKKKLCCSGSISDDPNCDDERFEKVLQFSGDQRKEIAAYLVKEKIVRKEDVTVHGY